MRLEYNFLAAGTLPMIRVQMESAMKSSARKFGNRAEVYAANFVLP